MTLVYLIHRYGGNPANLNSAEHWAAWLTEHFDALFVVPWVPLCRGWPDTGDHRRVGLELDLAALERCDRAIAVCGGASSPGGSREWMRAVVRDMVPVDLSEVDTPDNIGLFPGALALLEREFGRRVW